MGKNFCGLGNKWCIYHKKLGCNYEKEKIHSYSTLKSCPWDDYLNTKSFKNILEETSPREIMKLICLYHPGEERNYRKYKKIYDDLIYSVPLKCGLKIKVVKQNIQEGLYLRVKVEDKAGNSRNISSLGMSNIVYMSIDQETLNNLSYSEISAACLYEIELGK